MKCPKCVSPMTKVLFEGIEVDRCVDCHGLWFDEAEREDLMKRRHSEMIDNGDAHLGAEFDRVNCIVCPRCGSRMIPMVALGRPRVHFEQCTICAGSFFDAGEFRQLKQHPSICLPAY
jgi:Zn-finger nucleic acid-binding protein